MEGELTAESRRVRYSFGFRVPSNTRVQIQMTGKGNLEGINLSLLDSQGVIRQYTNASTGETIVLDAGTMSGEFTVEILSNGTYLGSFELAVNCLSVLTATSTAIATTSTDTAATVPSIDLQLFTSIGTLTLYVPQLTDLTDLTLVAINQRPFAFTARFESLELTSGLAPAESCYILRSPQGASEPILNACRDAAEAGRVSITNISTADTFWYDSLTDQVRAIGVRVGDIPITDAAGNPVICRDGQPICRFTWRSEAATPPLILPIPMATVTPTW